jgi:methionine synthase I (cobalamin-dependent)
MRFADCVRGSLILTDGAWGTELLKFSARWGECVDAWNLTKPELVRRVAVSYLEAGSRVILTNTFRANPISLADSGLQDECDAINRAGARISREAAQSNALVFASMGPSGRKFAKQDVTCNDLTEAFSRQAKALASEGPDAILIETMTELAEARIAAAAALETGLPVLVSFFFTPEADQTRPFAQATPEQAAATLTSDGVHGIGANCGFGVREFLPLCKRLAAASPLPIWIKPNAGIPQIVEGKARYPVTPAEFACSAQELAEAGTTFLGGCCGATPEFIRALAKQPPFTKP